MQKALHKRFITKMDASPTFFGFGSLPLNGDWDFGMDRKYAKAAVIDGVLNDLLDKGINLIDTASASHYSEECIGKSIASRRNEYLLATKCGKYKEPLNTYYDFSYQAVKKSIDRSLTNLQTDSIDIMFIDFGPDAEKVVEDGETLRAMKEAQEEGKVKFLGASIDGKLAEQLILSNDFDVIQMEYNLLNQANESNIKLANEKGIGVFVRGGLAGGLLTSRVNALLEKEIPHKKKLKILLELVDGDTDLLHSLALNFLHRNKAISSILIGTKSINNFNKNAELLDREIDEKLLEKAITIAQ